MKNKSLTLIAVGAMLIFASMSISQPLFNPSTEDELRGPFAKVNLSTEQLKSFKELRLKIQKETLPIKNEIAAKRLELESLLLASKPDKKKIDSVVEEIGGLKTEAQKKMIAHRLAMREQLTEDQKAIWDAMPQGPKMENLRRHRRMLDDDCRWFEQKRPRRFVPRGEWW